jgi:hypothetical protein
VKDGFAPPAGIQGAPSHGLGAPPAPSGGRPGAWRGFPPLEPPRRQFKRRGPVWPGGKANRPLLGFPFPLHGRVPRVEGEGGRAAAPRRWEKERRAAAAAHQLKGEPRTGPGAGTSSPPRNAGPRRKKKGTSTRSGGISDRSCGVRRRREHLRHRGASTSPEHLHARNTDATSPAGRPRLHRRPLVSTAASFSLLPLGFLPVMASHVWSRIAVDFLPECWPSRRRIAVLQRMGLLGRLCL